MATATTVKLEKGQDVLKVREYSLADRKAMWKVRGRESKWNRQKTQAGSQEAKGKASAAGGNTSDTARTSMS